MATPDFRLATFTVSHENPFRLTPPLEQALDSRSTERAPTPPPDIAVSEVIDLVRNVYSQRVNQGKALLSLVDAELELIKKSACVCIFAGLTVFALTSVCWLLLNVLLGIGLHYFQVPLIAIILTLFVINLAASIWVFKQAQSAYRFINFTRLISLFDSLKW